MKDMIIKILKNTDEYVSGEFLSTKLGVTRSAVWKVISKLKDEGYTIESVTNRGYKLISSPDIVTEVELEQYLETEKIGRKVYHYDTVTSTNKVAREESDNGAEDGSLFVSEVQTLGRGRLGKKWDAPKGGLWMSILLRPDTQPENISQITLLSGLAVCKAISSICNVDAKIKWPNDVVVNGKKICGILTEMSAEADKINCLITGIGINVNIVKFSDDIRPVATSLKLLTGENVSVVKVAAEVLNIFEKYYIDFLKNGVSQKFLEEYKANCVTLFSDVKAMCRGKELIGKAVDITTGGEIIIISNGAEYKLSSGEVSVRGIGGYV